MSASAVARREPGGVMDMDEQRDTVPADEAVVDPQVGREAATSATASHADSSVLLVEATLK